MKSLYFGVINQPKELLKYILTIGIKQGVELIAGIKLNTLQRLIVHR